MKAEGEGEDKGEGEGERKHKSFCDTKLKMVCHETKMPTVRSCQ